VSASIQAGADFYRRNPFYCYDPLVSLLPFHTSTHPRRLLRAPNKIGKTFAAAYEAWAHLIGIHRWQRIEAASGWAMIANLAATYPVVCDALHQLEPHDLLDEATHYVIGQGYITNGRHMIRTRAGRVMDFRSGEGSAISSESGSVGWLWIDEPPKADRFGGAISRVAVSQGPVWMDFTPIGRPTGAFREHIEGNAELGTPPREAWEQHRPRLTQADCTTSSGRIIRSAASIEAQVAAYSPWEYEQRVNGEWEGVSVGRRLSAFSESCYIDDDEEIRVGDEDELRVGIDHGEGDGKEMAYLGLVSGRRYTLLGEYVGKAGATPREHASGILSMLQARGLSVYDIAHWIGDVNSAGLIGAGTKYNTFLEYAFADELGVSTCPFSIETPPKGKGSVAAGEAAINHACREGRWRIATSCVAFSHAARHYTGKEKDLKDPIDGARYTFLDRLLRDREASVRVIRR
jgi:hypothetical protein